jgi:hypothetical protein
LFKSFHLPSILHDRRRQRGAGQGGICLEIGDFRNEIRARHIPYLKLEIIKPQIKHFFLIMQEDGGKLFDGGILAKN